jgi:hypothetical protein
MRISEEFLEKIIFDELESSASFILGSHCFQLFHPLALPKRHYLKFQLAQAKLADNGFSYDTAIAYIASACKEDTYLLRSLIDQKHGNDRAKRIWATMVTNSIREAISSFPAFYEPSSKPESQRTLRKGQATIEAIKHFREVLDEALPTLLRMYGLSRAIALELPSWEFDLLTEHALRTRARSSLDHFHMSAMAFGGKADDVKQTISNLQKQAGYSTDDAPKRVSLPTEDELAIVAQKVRMMDRRGIHY